MTGSRWMFASGELPVGDQTRPVDDFISSVLYLNSTAFPSLQQKTKPLAVRPHRMLGLLHSSLHQHTNLWLPARLIREEENIKDCWIVEEGIDLFHFPALLMRFVAVCLLVIGE